MSETATQLPSETLARHHAGLTDPLNDPKVSLGEVLTEAGIEGLSSEGRLDLVEHATVDEYMTVVDAIHRKVAPDDSHDQYPKAGELVSRTTGEVNGYAAQPEERAGIMGHALEAAKQVAQKYHREGGSIEDALQRCGNLVAFGVVLAHNYENGNGRTARVLGQLVHYGFDSSDPESMSELSVLSTNRPLKGFHINSYSPSPLGEWGNGRANQDPIAFLNAVAAMDTPLDGASYALTSDRVFTTPRM